MHPNSRDLIYITSSGKILVITDIHGNLEDFKRYESIFKGRLDKLKVVLTGDLIHEVDNNYNGSVEVLERVKRYYHQYPNFHVLLGNHEWAHLADEPAYKMGVDQKRAFEVYLQERFGGKWGLKFRSYLEFFRELPVAIKTENGVLISHAGPYWDFKSQEELENITRVGYKNNYPLEKMMLNRPNDYSKEDLEHFLELVGCKVMVVGHTITDGVDTVHGKQMILSSSLSAGRKAYLELDLEAEINDVDDLTSMVRWLD
jgi:hypothetical protein